MTLLEEILSTRFVDSVPVGYADLRAFLEDPRFPTRAAEFKRELVRAITEHTISPALFEKLTATDQDSQEDVDRFLLEELWRPLYGDESVRP